MNNKGQAFIEAVFGFGIIAFTFCTFGCVVLIGGTHLILDHELDRFVLCLAAEKSGACKPQSQKRLQTMVPWLEIRNYSGRFNINTLGYGEATARIIGYSKFKAPDFRDPKGITWRPLKFKNERRLKEQEVKAGLHY